MPRTSTRPASSPAPAPGGVIQQGGAVLLARAANQLVPITERTVCGQDHANTQAALDASGSRTGGLFEQPRFGPSGDDAYQLGDLAGCRRQTRGAGENRVTHGGRDVVVAGRRGAPDRLWSERCGRRVEQDRHELVVLGAARADRAAQGADDDVNELSDEIDVSD